MKKYIFILGIFWCGYANAGLMNSGVTANYHFNDYGDIESTSSTTVSEVAEWTKPNPFLSIFEFIDIGNDYIHFEYVPDACCQYGAGGFITYNGFEFIFDSGVLSDLKGASFAENLDGYVDSMLSFENDTLFVNWMGAYITDVDSIRIDLSFDSVSVPEPSSLILLGIGIAGFGLLRKRKSV